jgi:hypothetical protein
MTAEHLRLKALNVLERVHEQGQAIVKWRGPFGPTDALSDASDPR